MIDIITHPIFYWSVIIFVVPGILLWIATYIVASYTQPVSTGTYYLNNGFSGKYLGVTSNSLLQENGLLISLGQGYRWMLTKYSGGYTIQSMSGSGNYLGVHLLSGKFENILYICR